jgi:hypothetical protein
VFELVDGALVRTAAEAAAAAVPLDVQADGRSNKALLDDGQAQARDALRAARARASAHAR